MSKYSTGPLVRLYTGVGSMPLEIEAQLVGCPKKLGLTEIGSIRCILHLICMFEFLYTKRKRKWYNQDTDSEKATSPNKQTNGEKKETCVAIGAPAYRMTIERYRRMIAREAGFVHIRARNQQSTEILV